MGCGVKNEIDAEFRVVGEDRWAPFRRWLYPHLKRLGALAVVFAIAFAIRLVTAPIYDHMMGH
jgi:hypothetical protein